MAEENVSMSQVEALHVALQQSFSPDRNVRDPAEAAIKNLKYVPGATQMLLHITEEKQVSWVSISTCHDSLIISCTRTKTHLKL